MSTAAALQDNSITFVLTITSGPHVRESFTLTKPIFTMGRGPENDIILINDPKLSRNHVKFILENGELTAINLSQRNPLFFKGRTEQRVTLLSADKIKIGDTEVEINWQSEPNDKTKVAGFESMIQYVAEQTGSAVPETQVIPDGVPEFDKTEARTAISQKELFQLVNAAKPTNKATEFKGVTLATKVETPMVRYTPTAAGAGLSATTEPNKLGAQVSGAETKRESSPNRPNPLIFLVVVVIAAAAVVFSGGEKKPKKVSALKSIEQINAELDKPSEEVNQYKKDKKILADGKMDRQYESAQSYYVKGFRDYRQGQYARAMMSFQAALSFDPGHVLARRYLNQSIKKQSEIVQFNLDQARRYRQKNNFRLCRSAAQQVMVIKKDPSDAQFKTAKVLFDECDTMSKGRF